MRTAALPAHGTQPFGASILAPMPAPPRYPSLTPTTAQLALTLVAGRQRSFRKDAQEFVGRLSPPLRAEGHKPPLPLRRRVILANHHRSPGFPAWWNALALTAVLHE